MADKLKESELAKIKSIKRQTTVENVCIGAGTIFAGATLGGSIGFISHAINEELDIKAQAKLDSLASTGASEKEIQKVIRNAKIRKAVVNIGSTALEFCTGYTLGVAGSTIIKLNNKNKNAELSKIYAKANAKDSK